VTLSPSRRRDARSDRAFVDQVQSIRDVTFPEQHLASGEPTTTRRGEHLAAIAIIEAFEQAPTLQVCPC
jgi:hypothetical protein